VLAGNGEAIIALVKQRMEATVKGDDAAGGPHELPS
jgi:hypothetical protein